MRSFTVLIALTHTESTLLIALRCEVGLSIMPSALRVIKPMTCDVIESGVTKIATDINAKNYIMGKNLSPLYQQFILITNFRHREFSLIQQFAFSEIKKRLGDILLNFCTHNAMR